MMKKKSSSETHAAESFRRYFFPILLGITLSGLALRLGVSLELAWADDMRNSVFMPPSSTDLATYWKLSGELMAGVYQGEFYYQPFYYAVFLPIIRWIFGASSIWGLLIVQSILGAWTVWLAGVSCRRFAGRSGGLIAASLTAISVPLLFYTPYAAIVNVQAFNLILLFYLCLRTAENKKFYLWIALSGAFLGIAALTRGNALLLLPGIVLFWLWNEFRHRRFGRGISGTLLGLFLFALVQLPFVIHNSRIRGAFTGPSTASGQVLALGNTPEAPPGGRNPGLPAGPMEYPTAYGDFMARAAERPVPLQILDWMVREPGAFFELQFRKLLLFWDYREIPNNVSLYSDGRRSGILELNYPGTSGILLALALAGFGSLWIRLIRKRDLGLGLLLYFVSVYWGSTALFYNLSRFRAPILPLAAILAGIFVVRLYGRLHRKGLRPALPLLGALAIGSYLVFAANDFYRDSLESAIMRMVRPHGTHVMLKDGRRLIQDSGPFSFGGWDTLELQKNMRLEKHFAKLDNAHGTLLMRFVFEDPSGYLRCRINGKEHVITASAPEPSIHVGVRKGKIQVDILEKSVSGVHIVLDRQRDYARSTLDGKLLPGEYVMQFKTTL